MKHQIVMLGFYKGGKIGEQRKEMGKLTRVMPAEGEN